MKKNVGNIDRVIRLVAGTAIILWGISTQNWLGAIGIIPILTGLLRWCPAYCPLGLSTNCNSCCSKE
jgi:hypothetical protein